MLRFRPRGVPPRGVPPPGAPPRGGWQWPASDADHDNPVEDLAKYEQADTNDDYRHRMTMNLLTLLIAALLIAGGVWLSTKLVENRKLQDCFLSGRRNCAPIVLPPRSQE